jgi:hypothetical protein
MAYLISAAEQRGPEFGDYFRAGQELVPPPIKPGVGQEGRNRCLLSAFRARTGRNPLATLLDAGDLNEFR